MRGQLRKVLPLTELRSEFSVSRAELSTPTGEPRTWISTTSWPPPAGSRSQRTSPSSTAGRRPGSSASPPHRPTTRSSSDRTYANYPSPVAKAVENLLEAGVSGPYGLALGPAGYTGVVETTEHGGLVVFDHLRQILGGPIVWAPGVEGAVVVSMRGGDFLFESGEDLSVGYSTHDAEHVELYFEESFTFRVVVPEAA